MMSRARIKAWQKAVVRRLSGGEVKVRRYTPGVVDVQTNVPLLLSKVGDVRTGTVKSVLVAIFNVR
jgi:hypothetical protein